MYKILFKHVGTKGITRVDHLCGTLSNGDKRAKKCKEVTASALFKATFPDIVHDDSKEAAALPKKSCVVCKPSLSPSYTGTTMVKGLSTEVKMFQCPFKHKNGSGLGHYYAFQGLESDSVFLVFLNSNNEKKIFAWYSNKPTKKG